MIQRQKGVFIVRIAIDLAQQLSKRPVGQPGQQVGKRRARQQQHAENHQVLAHCLGIHIQAGFVDLKHRLPRRIEYRLLKAPAVRAALPCFHQDGFALAIDQRKALHALRQHGLHALQNIRRVKDRTQIHLRLQVGGGPQRNDEQQVPVKAAASLLVAALDLGGQAAGEYLRKHLLAQVPGHLEHVEVVQRIAPVVPADGQVSAAEDHRPGIDRVVEAHRPEEEVFANILLPIVGKVPVEDVHLRIQLNGPG